MAREVAYKRGSYERKYEISCEVCGKTFMGTARAMYCTNACECKAKRARKKARSGK